MRKMTKRLVVLVFAGLVLILSDRVVGLDFVRSPVQRVAEPVEYGLFQVGSVLARGVRFVESMPLVYQENQRLRDELSDYFATQVENESLHKENLALRKQLKVQGAQEHELILARVLGMDVRPGAGRLMIDRGQRDGVIKGSVAVGERFLVGRVVQIQEHQSVIETIFSPDSRVPIRMGEVEALLQGEFGQKLMLGEIPPDAKIMPGELIVTTGASGIYPPNLIVGRVARVMKNDNLPYLSAEVEPVWRIGEVEVVFLQR